MKKHLLPQSGTFYKANLHCHTNVSDGNNSPEQIKEAYMSQGYSVVAYTDHDILIGHGDLCDENFVALNGMELEIDDNVPGLKRNRYCHICYIALEPDNLTQPMWERTGKYLHCESQFKYAKEVIFDENQPDYERVYSVEGISQMMQIGRDKGFFVTYNHPVGSGENYEQYTRYLGMHAMEICNFSSYLGGHDEYNPNIYDDILRKGNRIYAVAGDDNHSVKPYYGAFGAYTMIKADKLEYRAITKALEDGNFYSSLGPEIYELYVEDDTVHIKCSPAKRITMNVGQYLRACRKEDRDGGLVTEASFKIERDDDIYFRLTVIDEYGRPANTNAYFCDEVF